MSRVTYRGRDQWSSRGATRHYRLPMAPERGPLHFTTIAAKWLAAFTLIYFGLQLLRPFIGESW